MPVADYTTSMRVKQEAAAAYREADMRAGKRVKSQEEYERMVEKMMVQQDREKDERQ